MGGVCSTEAGKLKAQHLIYAVAPGKGDAGWYASSELDRCKKQLADATLNSLEMADCLLKSESLSIPGFDTVPDYNICAEVMIKSIKDFSESKERKGYMLNTIRIINE